MKYLYALIAGILVAFMGYLVSAFVLVGIFSNGSVESSFHAMTQGLLIFLIIVIVVCTFLILEEIKKNSK